MLNDWKKLQSDTKQTHQMCANLFLIRLSCNRYWFYEWWAHEQADLIQLIQIFDVNVWSLRRHINWKLPWTNVLGYSNKPLKHLNCMNLPQWMWWLTDLKVTDINVMNEPLNRQDHNYWKTKVERQCQQIVNNNGCY